MSKLFPACLIAINIGAAIVSIYTGDYRRGIYWVSSAISLAMVAL